MSGEEKRQIELRRFVEQVGLSFEEIGVPRMAGRILGRLLVCDPPQQSVADLVDALQASKSSISTMTRLLIQLGLIERATRPGDRRDYFGIHASVWHNTLRVRMAQITAFRQLAERGLKLIEDQSPEQRQRLAEMRDLYAFFEHEYPAMLERWEKENKETLAKVQDPSQG